MPMRCHCDVGWKIKEYEAPIAIQHRENEKSMTIESAIMNMEHLYELKSLLFDSIRSVEHNLDLSQVNR